MPDLITRNPRGLFCEAGGFYIDPWLPVDRAVITHAHADHCRPGHAHYLAHTDGLGLMRARLGDSAVLDGLPYGATRRLGDVQVSLHPAGHVLGSAQVRLEHRGEVWVVAGDYFVSGSGDSNTTCAPFEPVRCDVFVTESTFGLPIYRWAPQGEVLDEVRAWWADCAAQGQQALLMGYSLGKAQRLVAGLAGPDAPGPVRVHPAVERLNAVYRAAGIALPATEMVTPDTRFEALPGALVIAPPGVQGSRWATAIGPHRDAFASGWMRLRGARRRRGVDRGFVFSDHADWPGLLAAIDASGAQRVIVTHGDEGALVRFLSERGLQAQAFQTAYGDDDPPGGLDGAPEAAA